MQPLVMMLTRGLRQWSSLHRSAGSHSNESRSVVGPHVLMIPVMKRYKVDPSPDLLLNTVNLFTSRTRWSTACVATVLLLLYLHVPWLRYCNCEVQRLSQPRPLSRKASPGAPVASSAPLPSRPVPARCGLSFRMSLGIQIL
jgi:hypothetical protein